jgi:hypothetical protein
VWKLLRECFDPALADQGATCLFDREPSMPKQPSAPTSTILAVKVGGVAHRGHYQVRNEEDGGIVRVTYGSSCKATQSKSTQIGGMSSAPWVLARIMLAEQAREALGHNEAED